MAIDERAACMSHYGVREDLSAEFDQSHVSNGRLIEVDSLPDGTSTEPTRVFPELLVIIFA